MKPEPRYKRGDKIGGRYQVHDVKMGGMGEVYLCLDLEELHPFALKTFQRKFITNVQQLRHALNEEAATWIALEKHQNIVRCYYMDEVDNVPFLRLEWVVGDEGRGTNLHSWLQSGPLEFQFALEVTIDVCRGLLHAQNKQPGFAHCDLKPENILIAQGGLAKVTDFGLAKITRNVGLQSVENVSDIKNYSFISRKNIAGTPAYMPLEQWNGEELDQRTDIYALGCILHEMLTGQPAFYVESNTKKLQHPQDWLKAIKSRHEIGYKWTPIGTHGCVDIEELIKSCLSKTKEGRPASLNELLTSLVRIYNSFFEQPPPPRASTSDFTAIDYNYRAITYYYLNMYEFALNDCNSALELGLKDAFVYGNRGNVLHKMQKHEDALNDFSTAISIDPTYARTYCNRGIYYGDLKMYAEAIDDFTRAIQLEPTYVLPYNNRGYIYAETQRYRDALADYTKAITLAPTLEIAYYNRGLLYQKIGQFNLAVVDFSYAIELAPDKAKGYLNRGDTYSYLGKHDMALVDYLEAVKIEPDNAPAYFQVAYMYHDLQMYDHAITSFNYGIKLQLNHVGSYIGRSVTYIALSRYQLALTDLDRACHLDPNNSGIYYYRGVIYFYLQQYERALSAYSEAIALNSKHVHAYFQRGYTYRTLQQFDQAIQDYSKAIELDPSHTQAYINRGTVYEMLQQHDAAQSDFSCALKLRTS